MTAPELGFLLPPSNDVGRVTQLGRLAEREGFDCVWIPDERFYREPYELLALLASKTDRVRLGPCVADPYTRHPTLTAVAVATLDEISDGRAVLAMGAGISGFRELGLERSPAPVPAVRSAIETIREHLRSAPRQTAIAGLDFSPRRAEVPIYVAAEGPGMLRLAGRVADGVILQAKVAPSLFRVALDTVRKSAAEAGRTLRVVSRVDVSVAASVDLAYEALRPRVARRLIASAPAFESFRIAGLTVPDAVAEQVRGMPYTSDRRVLEALGRDVPDHFVDAFCVASTPEGLALRFDALVAAGADHLLLHPVPNPDASTETIMEIAAAWHAHSHLPAASS